ncbi:MAG: efflux RND transporter periplasmic adaptor subunit [Bryobacteraceae bacterium]
MTKNHSFRVAAIVLCAFAVALSGCGKEEAAVDAKDAPSATVVAEDGVVQLGPDAPELKEMAVEAVKEIPVPADQVTAPATIEANPNRVGHAVVPAPGRIIRVMAKLGDSVVQGQPLVTIESELVSEDETAFVQAESAVGQAELALNKSEADLARTTDLYEHQAVPKKDVLSAQTTASLTKAALDQAKNSRDQARRKLELLGLKAGDFQQKIVVKAPISGKVLEVSVVEGEYRNEINTPLVTISDLSRVWATSEVPESMIRHCKIGGIVDLELIAYPNEVFHARVTRIADTVNSETRTIKVSAEMDNPGGKLRPEMFGQLKYAGGSVSTPWVPEVSIVRLDGKDFVFVEKETGKFLATPVELGPSHLGGFPVTSGLKAGDRIVTRGTVYLKAAL